MSIPRPLILKPTGWGGPRAPPGIALAEVASQMPVNVVKVAFYNLFPNNNLTFCYGMSNKHGWGYTLAAVRELQAAGIKVMASIIGTPDPLVSWNDMTDPQAFAQNAKTLLIDQLGFDGIDVDNEDNVCPGPGFFAVVVALRAALGPKGCDKALLTYPTYISCRDLPWLKEIGHLFDWVSTMRYWGTTQEQIALWRQYADVLGPENVVIGVALRKNQSTSLETVKELAQWESQLGPGATGGMMLWNLSSPMSQENTTTQSRQT